MNIPFDFSLSPGALTAGFKKLFDQTDNLILANIITAAVSGGSTAFAKLSDFNLGAIDTTSGALRLKKFYLRSISITADVAAKIRFGVYKSAGPVFAPAYTTFASEAVAGGIVRVFDCGPLVPHDGSTWFAAFEITPDAAGTVRVSGDVQISPVDITP